MGSKEKYTFEEAMKRMETIVEQLEGEVSLEDAVKFYQEGMELSLHCKEKLDEAEKMIETITEKNGEISAESIEVEMEE